MKRTPKHAPWSFGELLILFLCFCEVWFNTFSILTGKILSNLSNLNSLGINKQKIIKRRNFLGQKYFFLSTNCTVHQLVQFRVSFYFLFIFSPPEPSSLLFAFLSVSASTANIITLPFSDRSCKGWLICCPTYLMFIISRYETCANLTHITS